MKQLTPLFETNDEWYYLDENEPIFIEFDILCPKLTDKAPLEAVESYLKYCSEQFNYLLNEVPNFVYEEYNKAIARLNVTNKK